MKLSMSIIKNELPFIGAGVSRGELRFARYELLRPKTVMRPDVLYLTENTLPALVSAPNGGGIICVNGTASEALSRVEFLNYPAGTDFIELVNAVSAIFHKYAEIELALHEAVSRHADVGQIIKLAAQFFSGNELFLLSSNFRILAQSGEKLHSFELSGIPQPRNGILPEEAANYFKSARDYTESRHTDAPIVSEPGVLSCRIITMNISYRSQSEGLLILAEDSREFGQHDSPLLHFVAGFISQIFNLSLFSSPIFPENRLAEILAVMIRGEAIDLALLDLELSRHSWRAHDPYFCLCLQADELAIMNNIQPYYCNVLNSTWDNVCAFQAAEYIICLVNLKKYGGAAEGFLAESVEQLRDMCFRAGVSDTLPDIQDVRSGYLQSKIALKTGAKRDPLKWRYSFADYALDYIFGQITAELDAKHMSSKQLRLLINHDTQNKSEYCKTLYTYIQNGMNATQSAQDLFIHRTTMMYRLARIHELTKLDLSSANELLYINLSFVMLRDELVSAGLI